MQTNTRTETQLRGEPSPFSQFHHVPEKKQGHKAAPHILTQKNRVKYWCVKESVLSFRASKIGDDR